MPVLIEDEDRWLAPAARRFEGGSVLAVSDATSGYVLERARADFVATASHELRTPLTAVYGGARTLIAHGDDSKPASRTSLLQMIEQESEHLVQIVDQLLISAQLDRGALHLDVAECRRGGTLRERRRHCALACGRRINVTFGRRRSPRSAATSRCYDRCS